MSKISILSELLANKIAAGEVIERPASVVRELLDNSIDAGAKRITVEVSYGGRKLIRVSDDGTGMDMDDASLCFERHATSKLKSEEDLFNISTLGFRGEALSAIASVSKASLTTSAEGSDIGTKVEFGAGNKKKVTDAPPARGTDVEIRDIFYNTPARRKFLKTVPTELSHIIAAVTHKALPYPETAFLLKHNDSEVINVPPAKDVRERFVQLYSKELADEFLEVKDEADGIRLYGFTCKTEFVRAARNYQFIFVNRRFVKNPTVSHAVYSVYKDLIPKDKNPAFFLFLDIDPAKVDVNVHPAKREVRFEKQDEIHSLVAQAVKDALNPLSEKSVSGQFQADKRPHDSVREALESAFRSGRGSIPLPASTQSDFFSGEIAPAIRRFIDIGESFAVEVTDDGLVIIDRHAVHERVLYEKFLKKTSVEPENLFLPIRVEMPPKEFNIITNYKDLMHDFGLDIEDFGANNVLVRALPRELGKADMKGLLLDIVSCILEQEKIGAKGETGKQELLKNIAARLACHKSVRGRESLNDEQMTELISDLEKTEAPDKCPHGRPTRIFLSLDDLNKMFKRK